MPSVVDLLLTTEECTVPDVDTMASNGHAAQSAATAADSRPPKTVQIDSRLWAAVKAEQSRLGLPGSQKAFLERIIRNGLRASAQIQPINFDDQLAATIRTNGAK